MAFLKPECPFQIRKKTNRCKSTSKLCLFHIVTVVLEVPKVAHVFLGQTEQEQASSSFTVSTGFQKIKRNKPEIFRLLLKILASSSDLSSYSAKPHFIKRKIRNNVAFYLTDEK